MKFLVGVVAALAAIATAQAGNLLFNSSFELGDKGWSGSRRTTLAADGSFAAGDPAPAWTLDKSSAKFGMNSIRLDLDKQTCNLAFFSHDFLVEPSKTYTVSFWAKASRPGLALGVEAYSYQTVLRRGDHDKPLPDIGYREGEFSTTTLAIVSKKFSAGTEWTRFSFSFIPEKWRSAYCVGFSPTGSAADALWLDGIQVEEGALTDYRPAAPIEAAIYAPSLLQGEGAIEGHVVAIAYDTDNDDFKLPLHLYDTYFGKLLASMTLAFDLRKGEAESEDFSFDLDKHGSFCVFGGLQPRTTPPNFADSENFPESPTYLKLAAGDNSYQSAAFFVSVPKPRDYDDKGFKMGLTGGLIPNVIGPAYNWGNTPTFHIQTWPKLDSLMQVVRASGSNVYRNWDQATFHWLENEPENDKFDWRASDERMDIASKAGVPVMAVIGPNFGLDNPYTKLPGWVCRRDRLGHSEGTGFEEVRPPWVGPGQGKIILPNLDDWRDYVGAIATRYKGKIACYEVFNEPNLWIPAKHYVEYLRVAYEEIKRVDPEAKVQGICSSSDLGANLNDYLGKCLKLDAGKWMDIVTIHPYCITDDSFPLSQMEQRRKLLAAFKDAKLSASLWNGECYFLWPDWKTRDGRRLTQNFPADIVARYHIVDMGEGLSGSTPTYVVSYFDHPLRRYQYTDALRSGLMAPNEKFAAFAACAYFIAGAEPLHTVELPKEGLAYVFKNGDRLLSTVWNSRCKQRITMTITPPSGSSVTVYDVMGNVLEKAEKAITLPLSAKPYYMEWEGSNAEAVRDALKNATIKGELPLAFKNVTILKDKDTAKLFVTLENMSDKALENASVTLSSDNLQEPVVLKIARLGVFKEVTLEPVVKLKAAKSMKLVAECQGVKYACDVAAKEYVAKVTAAPLEFKIEKCVIGKTPDAKDLSATFKMSLWKSVLRLDVSVKDDAKGKSDVAAHEQDCVELFLDKTPLASGSETVLQQVMIPRKDGEFSKDGVSGMVKDHADGYDVSINIPLYGLNFIGFDVAVDDSDAGARENQLVWHGEADNYLNRNNFAILQLAHGLAARVDVTRDAAGNWRPLRHDLNDAVRSEWSRHSFTVTPEESGNACLRLLSAFTPNKERYWIYYRNVVVNGVELLKDEVKATHDKPVVLNLRFESGKPLTVSYEARAGEPVDLVALNEARPSESRKDLDLPQAVECAPRGGLPHFFAKCEKGGTVRVAYLGGSVTEQAGWRARSLELFRKLYPRTKFEEIYAALGGTTSALGVRRLEHDVLRFKPDLLFVEFSINDGGLTVKEIERNMEGIVRKTWMEIPACDICFVYTMNPYSFSLMNERGVVSPMVQAHEAVANHYGAPSIHLGLEAAALLKAGKLEVSCPQKKVDQVAGTGLNLVFGAAVNADGKIPFARDGVHPYLDTGHKLYTAAIERSIPPLKILDSARREVLPAPMDAGNYENSVALPVDAALLEGPWDKLPVNEGLGGQFSKRLDTLWRGGPGAKLSFKFKGADVRLYTLLGPDCGKIEMTVDGETRQAVMMDEYCAGWRLGLRDVATGLDPRIVHEVSIKVLPDGVDKRAILCEGSRQDFDRNPAKYQPLNFYVGAIFLVGELVK